MIYIGIATCNRVEKLKRLLDSIDKQTYKDIKPVILYDKEDTATDFYLKERTDLITCCYHQKTYVIEKWNSFHRDYEGDAHVTLVDDVELHTTCIERAYGELTTTFPDGDGVIGLNQVCPFKHDYKFQPTGQIMVGLKFLDRYPNRQICCPKYIQWYQDEELLNYANKLGKFKPCPTATLIHYHPAYVSNEMDATHALTRNEIYKKDTKIYNERKISSKVWGELFD
jgi:hypothetical protein